MTRREFLAAGAGLVLPVPVWTPPLRFGVISDVHFGLATDAFERLQVFVTEVKKREGLDFVLQLGDFCHPTPETETRRFLDLWNSVDIPRHHVLGNHDMDRGTKSQIMRMWGMPERFYSFEKGGVRFITLDLNHFRKGGKLHGYAHGNYFTDNATHNWADPEQLVWLERELLRNSKPTIILSHQPLGIPVVEKEQPAKFPPEQMEVLDILVHHNRRHGNIVACMFGHLHVDRIEQVKGIPCFCLNSASYFWQRGMHPYRDPLFAFVTLGNGMLRIEGRVSEFVKSKPEGEVIGCSASIADRRLNFRSG